METNKKINDLIPFEAIHPLDVLKDEIKARGISNAEFAKRIEMKPSNLCRMIKSRHDITIAFANKLETALGIDATFWLNLQSGYLKDVTAIAERNDREREAAEAEKMLASSLNLKELYAKLNIRTTLFIQEKLSKLQDIFGVDALRIPTLQMSQVEAYKRSDKIETSDKNLKTWSLLALASAKNNAPVKKFEKGNAKIAASQIALKANTSRITEEEISQILKDNGISYSVVNKLEKTPVDAYSSWWLDYPSIVTTHRFNDINRLVFNVLHELGHIELHLTKNTNSVYITEDGQNLKMDNKEKEANEFAEDMIVSPSVWKEITRTGGVGIGAIDIVKYLKKEAAKRNLNFGLLIWRYRFETNRYALYGVKTEAIGQPITPNVF